MYYVLLYSLRIVSDYSAISTEWLDGLNPTNYFSTQKNFSLMSYSRARTPLQYNYALDDTVMPRVTSVRDLGLEMVPDLTFRHHITDICAKSFRCLGFVLRQCSNFKDTKVIKALYNALVRSHLECNSIIWNPHEGKYNHMIEKIHKKFTRFLYLKEYGVYPYYPLMYPSLFVLGMVGYCKLSIRRDVALVKYVCRVLRGDLHHPEVLAALKLRVPDNYVGSRRRPALLQVPASRTALLDSAPISRAVRLINHLSSNNIDIFAHSLPKLLQLAQAMFESSFIDI